MALRKGTKASLVCREAKNRLGPEHFRDPIALQTKWDNAPSSNSSSFPRRMVVVNPHRLEFQASILTKFLAAMFIIVSLVPGLFVLNFLILAFLLQIGKVFVLVGIAIISPFIILSLWMEAATRTPIIFDKSKDYFFRKNSAARASQTEKVPKTCKLSHVHALQLICIQVSLNYANKKFNMYELNLVLRDGSRINVLSDGALEQVRKEARFLAAFLHKPLWDAA